jgi:hypothetical protein
MDTRFSVYGNNITTDPSFQNECFGNPGELSSPLNALYLESRDKRNSYVRGNVLRIFEFRDIWAFVCQGAVVHWNFL